MIAVTGLKTSKLEKGFSLHAKEIGPGPGVLVSNGECENIYIGMYGRVLSFSNFL